MILFEGSRECDAIYFIYLVVPCFELRELGKLCCMFLFYVFYF